MPPALAQPTASLIGAALPRLPAVAGQRTDRLPESALGSLARAFRPVLASTPGHVDLLDRVYMRTPRQSRTRCRSDDRPFTSSGLSPSISAIAHAAANELAGAAAGARRAVARPAACTDALS